MSSIRRSWTRNFVYTALTSLTLLIGCSDPDGPSDLSGWPPFTPDASSAVTADSGGSVTPVSDAGATATPDTGTGPQPQVDAGNTQMDSSIGPQSDAGDGAVQSGDASDDGSVSMDGSVAADAGDAATDDGATGDGAVGDGSIGDGSSGDGSSGDGSSGDGSTSDAGPRVDLGKGNGSDVVTIGDSWLDNTLLGTGGGIAPALRSVSGQRYRNYAIQGTKMFGISFLLDPPIPTQWDKAVAANPNIKTVVMTGGGNDVIQDASINESCKVGGPECKALLEKVGQGLSQLWAKMAARGVQDIVHIMYAKVAGDGVKDGEANAASLKMLCDNVPAPTRCHLFFTDTYVRTKSDLADGIHPKAAINTNIARGVLDYMTKQGMRR